MTSFLCISVRFLQPYSHGRNENGEPEWPPSPLRMVQALIAASAGRWNERREIQLARPALKWLEALSYPQIIACVGITSDVRCQFYVPDNTADLLVSAWKKGDIAKQPKRTEKVVCPNHLNGDAVHYLYPLLNGQCPHLDVLTATARSITHLGWGIDMAVGDASIISDEQASQLPGQRWSPSPTGGVPLRAPRLGTLDDLLRKHADFLGRVTSDGFRPVPPLRVFDVVRYRRHDEPLERPYRVFELRNTDGARFRYSHRRLIHLAGMLRHLAIEAMKIAPPRGVGEHWVETYVAGHRQAARTETVNKNKCIDDTDDDAQREEIANSDRHRQLSYLPLPSLGHPHADPGVRRVMIAAPVGDDALLDHVARRLAGQALKPLRGDEFAGLEPPILVPVRRDNVAYFYTEPASVWHSFTPIILPGHDDHKPQKTRALIERALAQSGVEQPCEFEWSSFSRFPKSYSAHKYDKRGPKEGITGYIRPNHLLTQTAVHLTLRFYDGVKVPGPLAIGAGRHCGLGLLASIANSD